MPPNPALRKLGFSDSDRVVILHADDIGMCQASLSAYADLVHSGLPLSASAMTPCAWFPALAATCRAHPGVDVGVHLTLTSEWDGYRWGPLSTRDPASGLIDAEGCFYRTTEDAQRHADPAALEIEINAQVARALTAGVDVTHIDTHMGVVVDPRFIDAYIRAALTHRLPLMLVRWEEQRVRDYGFGDDMVARMAEIIARLDAHGVPMPDDIQSLSLAEAKGDIAEHAKRQLGALLPGITHFVFHPSQDTPELRAITADWRWRVADYQVFMRADVRQFIEREGLHMIGYRALRDLLRGGGPPSM